MNVLRCLLPFVMCTVLGASAQVIRDDFLVSDDFDTLDHHRYTQVAGCRSGNYVVSWLEEKFFGEYEIAARLFGADGRALSGEIDVTQGSYLDEPEYALAMADSGEFVFGWVRSFGATRDEVIITRFNKDGSFFAQGSNLIMDYRGGDARFPDVSVDNNGNVVAAITLSGDSSGSRIGVCPGVQMPAPVWIAVDTAAYGAQVAMADNNRIYVTYNASGVFKGRVFAAGATPTPVGNAFDIGTIASSGPWDVSAPPTGGFVVAWEELNGSSCYDIRARRYDEGGTLLGQEISVEGCNYLTPGMAPRVTTTIGGAFAVAWNAPQSDMILLRTYTNTGAAFSGLVEVLDAERADAYDACPALMEDFTLLVGWSDSRTGRTHSYTRRISALGAILGPPLRANGRGSSAAYPDVAVSSYSGNAAVVWEEYDSSRVYMRLYDGYEGTATSENILVPQNEDNSYSAPTVAYEDDTVFVLFRYRELGYEMARFDATGTRLGALYSITADTLSSGDVAMGGGRAVAVWTADGSTTGGTPYVSASVYSYRGVAVAEDIMVAERGDAAGVVVHSDGSFTVVYHILRPVQPIGSSSNVFVKHFSANGDSLGPAVQVNDVSGRASRPRVGAAENGTVAISWLDQRDQNLVSRVYCKLFFGKGAQVGPDFRIDSTTTPKASLDMAVSADGGMRFCWLDMTSGLVETCTYNADGSLKSGIRRPPNQDPLLSVPAPRIGGGYDMSMVVWADNADRGSGMREIWGETEGLSSDVAGVAGFDAVHDGRARLQKPRMLGGQRWVVGGVAGESVTFEVFDACGRLLMRKRSAHAGGTVVSPEAIATGMRVVRSHAASGSVTATAVGE